MLYWGTTALLALLIIIIIFLLGNKRYRWLYIVYKTLPRDITAGYRFLKLNRRLFLWTKNRDTVPKIFTKLVKKHPEKAMFYFENQTWTFLQIEEFSNRIAHYFKSEGYEKGDSVALLLENRPEYVGIWLGLSKIGVVTALINTNLVAEPLEHCIKVAHSKALIYGTDFSKVVSDISNNIQDLKLYEFGSKGNYYSSSVNLSEAIASQPTVSPPELDEVLPTDKIVYIYTSGTTGLPKAAVISNIRYIFVASGLYHLADLSEEDVFYNPLPLYHGAGGMLAAGQALIYGVSLVVRRKFSASNYWSECAKYECTVANYIGEICRYLLAVHKPTTQVDHRVKKMVGNGLRPQIWKQFIQTFRIKNVYEFYGSTEGNSNLINIDNTVGAVGFVPRYASFIYPVVLIRCDESTGEPLKNKAGFCMPCQPNEPGILIGKINSKRVQSDFAGYADKRATQKKVLKDVFRKGDAFFNSGDVLVQDELGNCYFKDRTGDTFRWKGENVATSEVEAVISQVAGLNDAVVYGVQIPGTEGRAGMAAIVDPDNKLDLANFADKLKAKLPAYAVPIFLRIMDSLPMTGTFKLKKMDLQKEAFDYDKIVDHRLYVYDSKLAAYTPLTKEMYEDVIGGRVRL